MVSFLSLPYFLFHCNFYLSFKRLQLPFKCLLSYLFYALENWKTFLMSRKSFCTYRHSDNSEIDSGACQPFNVHRSRGGLTLVLILEGWVGLVSARFAVLSYVDTAASHWLHWLLSLPSLFYVCHTLTVSSPSAATSEQPRELGLDS